MTALVTPCREWQGLRNRDGYGRIWREGRIWLVHRWVWTLMNGPIPDGIKILHRCDNPPCFRLDHLFDGTQQENIADMTSKGRRGARPRKTHCPSGHPYSGDNLYIRSDGARGCRACHANEAAKSRQRRRNR